MNRNSLKQIEGEIDTLIQKNLQKPSLEGELALITRLLIRNNIAIDLLRKEIKEKKTKQKLPFFNRLWKKMQ